MLFRSTVAAAFHRGSMRSALVIPVLAFVLSGCGSAPSAVRASDEGTMDGGVSSTTLGGADFDPLEPSDASTATRVTVLFRSTCAGGPETSCHGSHAGDLWLRLRGPSADVVNAASWEVPTMLRVAPYDVAGSYLDTKLLEDSGALGRRMPLGGPYDPRIEALVRAWINEGAPVQ